MALSKSEISLIHARGIAKYKQIYVDEEGKTYRGTLTGRLEPIDKSPSRVQEITSNARDNFVEVQSKIVSPPEEAENVDEDDLDEALAKAKCFNIAMAVSL